MGLFKRKRTATTAAPSTVDRAVTAEGVAGEAKQALESVGQLDVAAEFPSATSEQAKMMEQMWLTIVSRVGGTEVFEPQEVAALSTLSDRLVASNPSLSPFVERLRSIASGESARRPSEPSWSALARHL